MEIIGIEKVDYVSKKTNQPVKGLALYTVERIDSKDGSGMRSERSYLSEDKAAALPEPLKVGDDVTIVYNRYGSIATVIKNKL